MAGNRIVLPTTTRKWLKAIIYDTVLWGFTIIIDLFFREIHPRTSYRIPRHGAVIFVAAPHANQFIDPLILMRTVKTDANRRIAFLIAEKSLRRKFVGALAGWMDSVSVSRALDSKKPAPGKIYLPQPDDNPTLIRGNGTDFEDPRFMVGGLLVLPSVNNQAANTEIQEIVSKTEIRLKKPFKGDVAYRQLTGQAVKRDDPGLHVGNGEEDQTTTFEGIHYSVAPHIDQSDVYNAVFQRLGEGGCIGIFPEGGSHDRTELLPLKAGVAVMALGAMAATPGTMVRIVPVGMNYFHAHKFRSRAVIEFGKPIEPSKELVEQYQSGNKREATGQLLDTVYMGLRTVTTLAPDYETLMLIQAVRRLYNPKGKKLPLSMIVELNRRLMKGYEVYKNDPRISSLRREVLMYNRTLYRLAIRDHQVEYARLPWYKATFLLLWRTIKLSVLSIAVIPGVLLFAPVFIAGKVISVRKAREALQASTVKVQAKDVIATWKVLVALALTPTLDVAYSCIAVWWVWYNRVQGLIPEWIRPHLLIVFIGCLILFPAACFMALRFGEIGMDIFKSLRPLLLALVPEDGNAMVQLRARRKNLTQRINDIVNELGPELFPDFETQRVIPSHDLRPETPATSRPTTPTRETRSSDIDALSFTPTHSPPIVVHRGSVSLPRNDSFKNIGSIGLFASRPGTPNRSRSRAGSDSDHGGRVFGRGFGLTAMDAEDRVSAPPRSKSAMEKVSRDLHAAMRERGSKRTKASTSGEAEMEMDHWVMEGRGTQDEEPKKVV